jgi:hypothetical protein
MAIKISKAILWGILGFLAGIILLCTLSLIFPWDFGGWNDGIPFGLFSYIPGFLIGSLIGIVVGVIIGWRINKVGKSVFIV